MGKFTALILQNMVEHEVGNWKAHLDFRDIFKYLCQFVFGLVMNKGTAKDLLNKR